VTKNETKTTSAAFAALVAVAFTLTGCTAETSTRTDSTPLAATATVAADNSLVRGAQELADCLKELGWEIGEVKFDGTFTATVTKEQNAKYAADFAACSAESQGDEPELTSAQIDELYALEAKAVECLASIGYEVELPSRQSYIDAFYSTEAFTSNGELGALPEGEYTTVNTTCPPPSWYYTSKGGWDPPDGSPY